MLAHPITKPNPRKDAVKEAGRFWPASFFNPGSQESVWKAENPRIAEKFGSGRFPRQPSIFPMVEQASLWSYRDQLVISAHLWSRYTPRKALGALNHQVVNHNSFPNVPLGFTTPKFSTASTLTGCWYNTSLD
jgi:hypothetical protein